MIRKNYSQRKILIISAVCLVALIYLIRLFWIQVVDKQYMMASESNAVRVVTVFPPRGLIYDRNDSLMVSNEVSYDLMVVPRQVKTAIDTALLCRLLSITNEEFTHRLDAAKKYSRYKPSPIASQISKEDCGYLQEQLYHFPGFYLQTNTTRKYDRSIAAHTIGYIGEVNAKDIENNDYYRSGDYIGKSGLEYYYEEVLRGVKGKKNYLVDVHNRVMGSFQEGAFDVQATPGKDLYTTIDATLQTLGEQLMENKRGGIVAIEPETGEILAIVSAPAYNPNLLIGYHRSQHYKTLANDPTKPLFNRAISAKYPPGSTFKPINGAIALQNGIITPNTLYSCQGPGSTPIKCTHHHQSPLNLVPAIANSCNPFFWQVFRDFIGRGGAKNTAENYNLWRDHLWKFGLGHPFDNDLPFQSSGNLPTQNYFDKYYGKGHWVALTIRSLSIGQGEIELTPLQLANMTAAIANSGYYITPHVVKAIGDKNHPTHFPKNETGIDAQHFQYVQEGMSHVFSNAHGTARYYAHPDLEFCGKTGTAQNPHGTDHSVFIGYAPKDNPKIAVAVIVENGGFGSTWAAPIATLIMEQYLTGETRDSWWKTKMMTSSPYH